MKEGIVGGEAFGDVPDHSMFSKNRHGRFRESDLLRKLFGTVVTRGKRNSRSSFRRTSVVIILGQFRATAWLPGLREALRSRSSLEPPRLLVLEQAFCS
jgi:hypothetical protein